MKGRPLVGEEYERMLFMTAKVVGIEATASWQHVLRGLWESGLRIGELLDMSWDDPTCIRPDWQRGVLPVLAIPHAKQKNATEESIPLLPGFEALLLETPERERSGWVFNPLATRGHRGYRNPDPDYRPTEKWAGRVISRIGEKAGVVVEPATDAKKVKYASAHDLRRSCAERMFDAGVPEREVARVMRHASIETTRRHYAPGTVQKSAGVLRMYLGTVSDGAKKRGLREVA